MCRQQQETLNSLAREVLAADNTGLGVTSYGRVIETCSQSGLAHSHWECWSRAGATHSSLFSRLLGGDLSLTREDLQPLVEISQAAITVSTSVPGLRQQFPGMSQEHAQEVVELAMRHQLHRCTAHCTASTPPGQECSQYFPKLPSLKPLMANLKTKSGGVPKLHVAIQNILRGLPVHGDQVEEDPVLSLLNILNQVAAPPILLPSGSFHWAGMTVRVTPEMDQLLGEMRLIPGLATLGQQRVMALYHYTLRFRRHPKMVQTRRVTEAWVVNFNPSLLRAARTNIELDLVTHTLSTLQSYHTKGATTQTTLETAAQLEQRGGARNSRMAEDIRMASESGYKEMSMTEAYFRMDPGLHLFISNKTVSWVSILPPGPLVLIYGLR